MKQFWEESWKYFTLAEASGEPIDEEFRQILIDTLKQENLGLQTFNKGKVSKELFGKLAIIICGWIGIALTFWRVFDIFKGIPWASDLHASWILLVHIGDYCDRYYL